MFDLMESYIDMIYRFDTINKHNLIIKGYVQPVEGDLTMTPFTMTLFGVNDKNMSGTKVEYKFINKDETIVQHPSYYHILPPTDHSGYAIACEWDNKRYKIDFKEDYEEEIED